MSDNEKEDLTRLEDLSEYLHEEDEEVNAQLEDASSEPAPRLDLDQLEDAPLDEPLVTSNDETTSEFSTENASSFSDEEVTEPNFEYSTSSSDSSYENSNFTSADEENDYIADDFTATEFNSSDDNQNDFTTNDYSLDEDASSIDASSIEESVFSSDDFTAEEDDFLASPTTSESEPEDYPTTELDTNKIEPSNEEPLNENDKSADQTSSQEDILNNNISDDDSSYDHLSAQQDLNTKQESPVSPPPPAPESFQDVRAFAHNISYGKVTQGGNPPFTLLIRNINYTDDVEDIKIILKEYGLYTPENRTLLDQSLQQGALILPQLSEFTAIFIANKLRRFSGDIQLGLSDEIHPSRSIDKQFKGLVSKENILRNQKQLHIKQHEKIDFDNIIITTTPMIEGYKINEYRGIITEDIIIPAKFFHEHTLTSKQDDHAQDILSSFTVGSSAYYQDLIEKIKKMAIKQGANAIVGLTYTIATLPIAEGEYPDYKIVATGSSVYITPLQQKKGNSNEI